MKYQVSFILNPESTLQIIVLIEAENASEAIRKALTLAQASGKIAATIEATSIVVDLV